MYPGKVTRLFSDGAQCLKTSSENPPLIIPGVAKRTQGPGASIIDLSKLWTAASKPDDWDMENIKWYTNHAANYTSNLNFYKIYMKWKGKKLLMAVQYD